jgi:DtxR family Mn-dependent transcriptional regulator
MFKLSHSEQDYIKVIYRISERDSGAVSTNAIAHVLGTSAPSTTDMMKKLADKHLVEYKPYYGVLLTADGRRLAINILRRQRLWKVFLISKLRFPWEQVQGLADELEHVGNDDLIARLDAFLDFPKFDPLGDPIPNNDGRITIRAQATLAELKIGQSGSLIGVRDDDSQFLTFLSQSQIRLGSQLTILNIRDFDGSIEILIDDAKSLTISKAVCHQLVVKKH